MKTAWQTKHTWPINLPFFLIDPPVCYQEKRGNDPEYPKINFCTGNYMNFIAPFWHLLPIMMFIMIRNARAQVVLFVCLICSFTSQSTTMVMLKGSVNLTTLFMGRLPKRLTSTKCTSFSPVTDSCPTWISGRKKMAIEIPSWPISTKECCRTRGSNPHARRMRIWPSYWAGFVPKYLTLVNSGVKFCSLDSAAEFQFLRSWWTKFIRKNRKYIDQV